MTGEGDASHNDAAAPIGPCDSSLAERQKSLPCGGGGESSALLEFPECTNSSPLPDNKHALGNSNSLLISRSESLLSLASLTATTPAPIRRLSRAPTSEKSSHRASAKSSFASSSATGGGSSSRRLSSGCVSSSGTEGGSTSRRLSSGWVNPNELHIDLSSIRRNRRLKSASDSNIPLSNTNGRPEEEQPTSAQLTPVGEQTPSCASSSLLNDKRYMRAQRSQRLQTLMKQSKCMA